MSKYNPNRHIERLKAIRPFVNFNYSINDIRKNNISEYDKRKIKSYFDELKELNYQKRYKVQFRNPARERTARAASGQSNKKGFKFTLIETDQSGKKPNISFSNDNKTMKTSYAGVTKTYYPFDKNNLARDHVAETQRLLDQLPPDVRNVSPQVGVYESIRHVVSPSKLPELIDSWMTKYKDKKPNEWINGINTLEPKEQKNLGEYLLAKRDARKAQREKNRKASKAKYDRRRRNKK